MMVLWLKKDLGFLFIKFGVFKKFYKKKCAKQFASSSNINIPLMDRQGLVIQKAQIKKHHIRDKKRKSRAKYFASSSNINIPLIDF